MRLRLPAVRRRASDRQAEPISRETVADDYLADRYAGEHSVGRYVTSGDTLVDRVRPADEDSRSFAGDHEPPPDAEEIRRRKRRAKWGRTAVSGLPALSGRAFAAITVAPALLACAWLLPGTGMLLAGRLQARPMVLISVPLAVAFCYFAMRQVPHNWPRFKEGDPDGADGAEPDAAPVAVRRKADVPAVALLAMLVVAAAFGVWQAVFRSEQIFVTSDPGVYLQYGYWIAEHGTARIPASASAFGGVSGLAFATPGFTVSGGSLTPSFVPGLPLVLAGGTWLGGLNGALLVPAVLGGCAVLSFGGLVGRLCGAWWAVVGEIVLGFSLPEVFTSRTPFSEPLVQVLLIGGLCLFIDALVARRRVLAGLSGLALGLTVLASMASVAALLPVFPVLAVLFVLKKRQAGPFGIGLVLGLAVGLETDRVLASAYLASLSVPLHLIAVCVGICYAATGLALIVAIPAVRSRVHRVFSYHVRVVWFKGQVTLLPSLSGVAQWLALVLPVVVLVGLAERPYLQTVRGQTDPAMIRAVAALQHAEGLTVDGLRQYYELSLRWVFWYLGAPVLLLACAGAAGLGQRLAVTVLEGRSRVSGAAASVVQLWALPFVIIAWSVVTVLWDPSVVPWQPMASHRLVPVVLPGLVLFGVWTASWLTARAAAFGASRAAVVAVGGFCTLALALPGLVTTLNPGLANSADLASSAGGAKLSSEVELRGVGVSATYGGSVAAAAQLCAAIGPSASVLVTDPSTAAMYAPVIRGLCGQPAALVVPEPTAAQSTIELQRAVRSVEQVGRHPVLLGPTKSSVSLPGAVPQQAFSLKTSGDAETLTGAPTGTWPVSYSAWLAVPAGAGA